MSGRKLAVLAVALALVSPLALGVWEIKRGFSARQRPTILETFVARAMRRLAVPASLKNARNPISSSPEVIAEARSHFADHCASCHANNGSGDTQLGQNMYPKPPDMRQPATQMMTDGELYSIIHNGVRLTGMPAWGQENDDPDSWKLVLFIRHLPYLTPAEEAEMEDLNPKSPAELREEKEEEDFLKGGAPPQEHHHTHSR